MTCLHYRSSQLEHLGMTWLNYIRDTSWNKHRGTIHKIYKWIHSEVTNTSTLPLNLEGILSTQFLVMVFFSVSAGSSHHLHLNSSDSSSHLHLQIIFIFKSSSSSNLDHLLIWIIMGHHYWIWIITRSGSSLGIITWSGSTQVLSHDSSRHRKFYKAIPFSCWL